MMPAIDTSHSVSGVPPSVPEAFVYRSTMAALVEINDEMRAAISHLCQSPCDQGSAPASVRTRRRAAQNYIDEITRQLLKIEVLVRQFTET